MTRPRSDQRAAEAKKLEAQLPREPEPHAPLDSATPIQVDVTEVKVKDRRQVMEGLWEWKNEGNKFLVLDLSYKADRRKRDPKWEESLRAGMDQATWEREYGDRWVVYDGKPVYPMFTDAQHIVTGDIIVPLRSRIICGWDAGPTDVNLAFVMGIVEPDSSRVVWVDEVFVDNGDVDAFLDTVVAHLQLEWNKLRGFAIHIGDPAMFTQFNLGSMATVEPTRVEKKSFADVLRSRGIFPQPGEVSFLLRRKAVQLQMTHWDAGPKGTVIAKWRVHERCQLLIEAMRGGYCYPKVMVSRGKTEKWNERPEKNKFSHIANAMEYAASRIDAVTAEIPFATGTLPRYGSI